MPREGRPAPVVDRRQFLAIAAGAGLATLGACGGAGPDPVLDRTGLRLAAGPLTMDLAGQPVPTWGYNGTVPGPELRLRAGDTLRLRLANDLPDPTTVHWHGINLPNAMDGVPHLTQSPVEPGAGFDYEFVVPEAGSFMYHAHVGLQLDRGLYGPLIVEPRPEELAYDREFTLMLDDWRDYLQHTAAAPQLSVMGENTKERIEFVIESGMGVIGTVDDAIQKIEQLQEQSNGGFGAYLMFAHNWAPWEATLHHYHLFANHVIPQFTGIAKRLLANEAWTRSVRDPLAARQWDAINAWTAKHNEERAAKPGAMA